MKTNRFEIRANVLDAQLNADVIRDHYFQPVEGLVQLSPEIWVDGEQLEAGVAIDFLALLDTTHKLKQSVWKPYQCPSIFTCGCGAPGCAGIDDSVEVLHDGPYVVWRAMLPLVSKKRDSEHPHGRETNLRFLKSQMVEQCQNFVATARMVSVGKLSCVTVPVYEESLDVLLRTSRFKWARKGATK